MNKEEKTRDLRTAMETLAEIGALLLPGMDLSIIGSIKGEPTKVVFVAGAHKSKDPATEGSATAKLLTILNSAILSVDGDNMSVVIDNRA